MRLITPARLPARIARLVLLSVALTTAACGPASLAGGPPAKPIRPHVFVIVMENKPFAQAMRGSYTASLAKRFAVATRYYALGYPSLPNHLALTSGNTWGIRDDGYYRLPKRDLGTQLTAAGISWRAYVEGFTGDCFDSPYPYALKHNPFAYYGGGCPDNVVALDQLGTDLSGQTPNLVWIVPDMCHSTHDCSVAVGDEWLSSVVPQILDSAAWRQRGVLFITWDEDGQADGNRVATVIAAPKLSGHQTTQPVNHYALLATIEDLLGVSRLGAAAKAKPMTDLLAPT